MRGNVLNHPLHAFHRLGKIEFSLGAADPVVPAVGHLREQFGRADQRLGGYAAGIQAIAAHLVFFNQRHLGLDRSGDVGSHQPGGSGTDHHQIAVKFGWFVPAGVNLARLDPIDNFLGDQREDAEQHKGGKQAGRDDAGQRFDLCQLRAGIHVNKGAGEHAELADPEVGADLHARQAHHQIDDEEGESRYQTQGEQVECTFLFNAGIDRFQALAKPGLNAVAQ